MNKNEIEKIKDTINLQAKTEKMNKLLTGALSIFIFLLIWQLFCIFELVNPQKIASPLEIVQSMITKLTDKRPDGNTLLQNIWASFRLAMTGFLFAVIIGLPLGLLMGWYKPVDAFISPIFEILRPLPPIAWIPIVIVLLGIGIVAKAFIIFFTTFVPIVINSYVGIKSTSNIHINYARTCGYSNWKIFLKVGVPSAMPLAFAGMQIALGVGWGTLVAAEMLASSEGMGYMIFMGRAFGRIDIIIGGMFVIGLIGLLLTTAVEWIERFFLRWRIVSK